MSGQLGYYNPNFYLRILFQHQANGVWRDVFLLGFLSAGIAVFSYKLDINCEIKAHQLMGTVLGRAVTPVLYACKAVTPVSSYVCRAVTLISYVYIAVAHFVRLGPLLISCLCQ